MSKNDRLLSIISLILATTTMSAHAVFNVNSIGDDGNPDTVGNAGVRNIGGFVAENNKATLSFNINNQSDSNISRVTILNDAGTQLYSGKIICRIGQKCTLNLGAVNISGSANLKFYDTKNKLVTVYVMDKPAYTKNIVLNYKWLGIYAFNQLVKASHENPLKVNESLRQFFSNYSSPDNTPDIFEELGLYFLAQNGGANENKFYNNLLSDLAKNKTLAKSTASTKPRVYAISTPLVQSGASCDPAAQSAFGYMETIVGAIPVIGDLFGALFGIGNQMLSDFCPADNSIQTKFDAIDNQLKLFNSELNTLGFKIENLAQVVNQNEVVNPIINLDTNSGKLLIDYFTPYVGLVGTNSLDTYVNKNNGLKQSFAKSKQLSNLLSTIHSQLNDFNSLMNNDQITKLKGAMDGWCKDSNTITGDIISNRVKCDVLTNIIVTDFASSGLRLKLMLKDEINTIAAAQKSGDVDAEWLKDNVQEKFTYDRRSYSWDKAADVVENAINDKIKFVNETLVGKNGEKLYQPLKDFPTELSQGMKNAKCISRNLPAVREWYRKTNTENNPYIVSQCDDAGRLIQSKYYYQKRNSKDIDGKVVNIMGVLVPDRYFHGGSGNNYGDGSAFPWAEYSTLGKTTAKSFDDIMISETFRTPESTLAAAYGFKPENLNNLYIPQGGFSERYSRNGNAYGRFIFNRSIRTGDGDQAFGITYYGADYWRIYSGEFFSFMRYTYTDGNSYLWAMRSKISKSSTYFILDITPQCVTNNCLIGDTSNKLDKVEFSGGPALEWTNSYYGYILNVDGKPTR